MEVQRLTGVLHPTKQVLSEERQTALKDGDTTQENVSADWTHSCPYLEKNRGLTHNPVISQPALFMKVLGFLNEMRSYGQITVRLVFYTVYPPSMSYPTSEICNAS